MLQTFLSVLTALGVGGMGTYAVTGGLDRRRARAEVRKTGMLLEAMRYGDRDLDTWRQVGRDFTAHAMTAGVPRRLAETYRVATQASWAISYDKRQAGRLPATPDMPVSTYIDAVRELLLDYLWHPWWTRWTGKVRRQLRRVEEQREQALASDSADAGYLTAHYHDI
jgi:hypothetical protein